MFNNNSKSSRTEQIFEQVSQPIQVPIIAGNDVYILTQQDVRKIIETRHKSYTRCPNGLMDLENFILQNNLNSCQQDNQCLSCNTFPNIPINMDMCNCIAAVIQQQQQNLNPNYAAMTGFQAPTNNRAPIQDQLDWEMRDCQAEKLDQFSYGKKTSTTDLKDYCVKPDRCCYNPRHIIKILISKGVNTCATEILEDIEQQRKDIEFCATPTAHEQIKHKKELDSKEKI